MRDKIKYTTLVPLSLIAILLLSGTILLSSTVSADDTSVTTTTITVPIACTMTGSGINSHTATLNPGTYSGASGSEYENGIGKTTLTAICNDDNGFSIYAIGYTGNSYDSENHTKLVGTSTGGTIATKAYASGDTTSNWSMKLSKVTDTSQSYNPQNLTLTTGYDAWHAVPDTYTKVAEYHANTGSSATDTTLGVKLETTYAAFIAANQPADTYTGQVKYTMVHPYNEQPLQPQPATQGCINYFAKNVYQTELKPRRKNESRKAYIIKLLTLDGRMYSCNNKLFRTNVIKQHHLSFDTTLNFAEDTKFVLSYLQYSKGEIVYTPLPLYVYNFGTETSTVKQSSAKWQNWQTSYRFLKSWLGSHPTPQEKFWLHLVHLRWRISYLRSKRRLKQ